jgi:hypothetical protein
MTGLSTPAAVYVGAATVIGLSSVGIAIVDHKRATGRGERMAPATGRPSAVQALFMGLGATLALYQTWEVLRGSGLLDEIEARLPVELT